MKTERLYWEKPLARDFEARILEVVGFDDRVGVILDRTLFHPEGGGQPADTGFITLLSDEAVLGFGRQSLRVVQVVEDGERIVHLVDGHLADRGVTDREVTDGGVTDGDMTDGDVIDGGVPAPALRSGLPTVPEEGWLARGTIDWDYRFDLMQQHTGQHILSRAFEELLDAQTVGFHLGKDYVSIDLSIPGLADEEKNRVEERANQIVFEDVSVTAREYPRDGLPGGIRTRFAIDADNVRVVSVGEYDSCPCGGTHVLSSGHVGLIKINQVDRAHGGVRVVFRCGNRALLDYREKERLLGQAAGILSVPFTAVPQAAESALLRLRDVEKELEEAREAVLDFQIDERARAVTERGEPVVVEAFESLPPDRLKYAAVKLSKHSGKLTVCFSRSPRFSVVVVSPSGTPDARDVISKIASAWGGRGGGMPTLAQLGSKEPLAAPDDAVVASIKEIVSSV